MQSQILHGEIQTNLDKHKSKGRISISAADRLHDFLVSRIPDDLPGQEGFIHAITNLTAWLSGRKLPPVVGWKSGDFTWKKLAPQSGESAIKGGIVRDVHLSSSAFPNTSIEGVQWLPPAENPGTLILSIGGAVSGPMAMGVPCHFTAMRRTFEEGKPTISVSLPHVLNDANVHFYPSKIETQVNDYDKKHGPYAYDGKLFALSLKDYLEVHPSLESVHLTGISVGALVMLHAAAYLFEHEPEVAKKIKAIHLQSPGGIPEIGKRSLTREVLRVGRTFATEGVLANKAFDALEWLLQMQAVYGASGASLLRVLKGVAWNALEVLHSRIPIPIFADFGEKDLVFPPTPKRLEAIKVINSTRLAKGNSPIKVQTWKGRHGWPLQGVSKYSKMLVARMGEA